MVFVRKSTFSLSVLSSKESQKETFFDILDRKQSFLDLKSEVLTNSIKSTFCKGFSPWFLSKNRPFSYKCFFFRQKAMKKHFLIFWKEHKVFGTQKWSSHKVEKNRHFAKGLVHGFCQKINLFLICFFWAKKSRKKHFFIFWIEKNAF